MANGPNFNPSNGPGKRPRNWSASEPNDLPAVYGDKFSQSYTSGIWKNDHNQSTYYSGNFDAPNTQYDHDRYQPFYQHHDHPKNRRYAPPGHGYLGSNFNPNHNKTKKAATRNSVVQKQELIPKRSSQVHDYKAQLESIKATTKLDTTDFFKQAEVTYNESWEIFIDPFRVLIAQRFFIMAADSLKIDEEESKSRGPSTILSDEEFNQQLTQAADLLKLAPSTSQK